MYVENFLKNGILMSIEVLVATMNQKDHSLLKKMNIKTDAIIGNQCNFDSIERFEKNGNKYIYINCQERGVGQNRNNALIRARADICLFADDDMVFFNDYENTVKRAFSELPDADVIIFNLIDKNSDRYVIKKTKRVRWYNCLRYGAARVAVRLAAISMKGIFFNQLFGGGCKFQHGEDNIFLSNCLKSGLRIYAVPYTLAELKNDRVSTWNKGYDKMYLADQGVLYYAISNRWWKLLCLQDAIRRAHKHYNMTIVESYNIMIKSVEELVNKKNKHKL